MSGNQGSGVESSRRTEANARIFLVTCVHGRRDVEI